VNFIYLWPTWLIIAFEVLVFGVPAVIGHALFRRLVPHHALARHNDVTGFVLAIVGVIYAVLLAFVVIIAWESFNTADGVAQAEVSSAADLEHLSRSYNDRAARELRQEITRYADLMRTEEWPAMQSGGASPHAADSASRIGDLAVQMIDGDSRQRTAVDDSVMGLVRTFADARRGRLDQNSEGIPSSLWIGLIVGALITIGFTYLFGVENPRVQLVVTALLAALIGLMFAMIIALDYPYRGVTSISPDIWRMQSYLAEPIGTETSFVYTPFTHQRVTS
jgi:hypothetical protein